MSRDNGATIHELFTRKAEDGETTPAAAPSIIPLPRGRGRAALPFPFDPAFTDPSPLIYVRGFVPVARPDMPGVTGHIVTLASAETMSLLYIFNKWGKPDYPLGRNHFEDRNDRLELSIYSAISNQLSVLRESMVGLIEYNFLPGNPAECAELTAIMHNAQSIPQKRMTVDIHIPAGRIEDVDARLYRPSGIFSGAFANGLTNYEWPLHDQHLAALKPLMETMQEDDAKRTSQPARKSARKKHGQPRIPK